MAGNIINNAKGAIMNFEELLEKYQAVLTENNNLKIEINNLKAQLGIVEQHYVTDRVSEHKSTSEVLNQEPADKVLPSSMNSYAAPIEKIKLFMSLFKGRDDVYAKRWESKKKGQPGYSPVCLNEWKPGVCSKPKIKCADCSQKLVISRHSHSLGFVKLWISKSSQTF